MKLRIAFEIHSQGDHVDKIPHHFGVFGLAAAEAGRAGDDLCSDQNNGAAGPGKRQKAPYRAWPPPALAKTLANPG